MNNIKEKSKIFLNAYIINAVVILLLKIIFSIINEDVISDILVRTFASLTFASLWDTKGFLFTKIDGVGPLAVFMILFISINISSYINIILKNFDKIKKILILIAFVIIFSIFYILLHFMMVINLPFSLLESLVFASILSFINVISSITLSDKTFKILSVIMMIFISIISYIYLFIGYFIDV